MESGPDEGRRDGQMEGAGPILCAHLLRRVDEELVTLLLGLSPEEWEAPTVAGAWKVRDVAAHLLDTALRKLSLVRDACRVGPDDGSPSGDLVAYVNRLNREGVAVYRRLSASLLTDLLAVACEQSARFHEALDPFAPAAFAVSWAGEEHSLNWFDTARELTERWHHQQQIRLATHRPAIMAREVCHPVLDCFARGLPHLYRDVPASFGTVVIVEITGDCGGRWAISRSEGGWQFVREGAEHAAAVVSIPQTVAWRLFTKGIDRDAARAEVAIQGDRRLGEVVLQLTAIVG